VSFEVIRQDVARYYSARLARFGATPAGVDWRDEASQTIRFRELLRVVREPDAAIVDLGCGYGGLLPLLRAGGHTGPYRGIDIAPDMIDAARRLHAADPASAFEVGARPSDGGDYVVASGIFNVRLTHDEITWQAYVLDTVAVMDRLAGRGFAFNCLTSYADPDKRRVDLFYADPRMLFDLCKQRYSRHVALLHDYGLYEFTMIVRKKLGD
jgi:SAM-dependent methyltransferase